MHDDDTGKSEHRKEVRLKNKKTKSCYSREPLIVEGSDRPRRHRHVTISPSKRYDANGNDDVTKIEVVLEEAPDAVIVGSMSSEMEAATDLNSTFPDGTGAVVVRAEEALIVILVLVLWVAAIALFFNRWGKIRMLEPYQPKFQQQHRQSCAMVDPNQLQHSKFNVHCLEHQAGCPVGPITRLRQNSVFVGSSVSLLPGGCRDTPRRAKSAFDLQSLVLAEGAAARDDDEEEERDDDTLRTLRSFVGEASSSRLPQRDRRPSVYQFDRTDVLARPSPWQRDNTVLCLSGDRTPALVQRERGMSICHFDRMDVLARPLMQRERGMSFCQFDRTDVLARPSLSSLQRDRGNSVCHFDRTDVLARPTLLPPCGKSLLRERRVSVCNFLERGQTDEAAAGASCPRGLLQRDRRLSVSNVDRIETLGRSSSSSRDFRGSVSNVATVADNNRQQEGALRCTIRERGGNVLNTYHFDRPSCSKTPDVALGYNATCV